MPRILSLLLIMALVLTGCGGTATPSSDTGARAEQDATLDETDSAEVSVEGTEIDDLPRAVLSPLEDSLFNELPELAECREMISEDMSGMRSHATREQGFANIITIPCGPSPGTGAYGFPLALVAEYEAMQDTPEGDVARLWIPIEFFDLTPEGTIETIGYTTQAIPSWTTAHIADGRIHLLYKYAGAGQCGKLITYETPAWRAGFPIWEVREQSCDEEGPADPMEWELVFEAGESGF